MTWPRIRRPACRFIPVLALIVAALAHAETLSSEFPFRYHYDDIDRFFISYDRFLDIGEPSAFASYLEAGTTGLKDFEEHFALTPEDLAATVQKYPAFFSSIRNLKSRVQSQEDALDVMFENLQALFPSHALPGVYFLVGGLRAGGQAGEFSAKSRIFSPEDIVHIVAHEAAHIIQEEIQGSERYLSIYADEEKGTLIAYSLREGAANLVAKLVSGNHINQEAEAYGMRHEAELWGLFREQALDTELGDWFFYKPKENPDWPRDLGYWIGYRMAQKCYESASDKSRMLVRILDAADPEVLLTECGL
jgi:hypothetical protein